MSEHPTICDPKPCPTCGRGNPPLFVVRATEDLDPMDAAQLGESLDRIDRGRIVTIPVSLSAQVYRIPETGIQGSFRDVLDFHRKFGCSIGERPAVPPDGTPELRARLIAEEFEELTAALAAGDLVGITDGALDLIYVVLGTLVSYGIDPGLPWMRIHDSNMAKGGGGRRPDGKILKGPDWRPPDIKGALEQQRPLSESYPPIP